MKLQTAALPARFAATALALAAMAALPGCSTISGWFGGDQADYKNGDNKGKPLEVPPDLTQLARDSRYQPQGGVISAAAANQPAAMPAAAVPVAMAASGVAPTAVGDLRIERQGQQRWLVAPLTPEQLWPLLRSFWEKNGYTLQLDNPQLGVMETNWAEDRTQAPTDLIRSTIGKVFTNLFDTGRRDLYRTRVERTATGSEVYIVQRGIEEVYVGERHEETSWRARPNDPQLEALMLTRLLVALGAKEQPAQAAVATAPDQPPKVVAVTATGATAAAGAAGQPTSLVVDEAFDRAWRRVGLALDRGGFTVEDRDRTAGLYYVRYIDPKNAGKDEPGWWAKLFGDNSNPQAALRYRIFLKPTGEKTLLTVQTTTGAPDTGENARRIVGILTNELR